MSELDKKQIRRAAARAVVGGRPQLFAAAEERLWERVGDMAQTPAIAADIGGDGAFVADKFARAKIIAVDFALPVLSRPPSPDSCKGGVAPLTNPDAPDSGEGEMQSISPSPLPDGAGKDCDIGGGDSRGAGGAAAARESAGGAPLEVRKGEMRSISPLHEFGAGGRAKTIWKICGDAEQLPVADGAADLVWSNLCVEWTNAELFFREAARILKDGGLFAFTAAGPDTLPELRAVFGGRVHAFADMHDLGDLLAACGFAEPMMEADRATLTYSAAAAAVRDMKTCGCANARADRPRGLLGKDFYKDACEKYGEQFVNADGKITATVELITATAWRKTRGENSAAPIHFYRRGAGIA